MYLPSYPGFQIFKPEILMYSQGLSFLFFPTGIYFLKWNGQYLRVYIIRLRENKSHLIFYCSISSEAKCFMPGQGRQKHKAIIQLLASSITSVPTVVKRCDFTSKQEEKAWTHLGSMFKKLINVSCRVLHLQFKPNSTWLLQRVWFIRYQGVARSHVIKTVIN